MSLIVRYGYKYFKLATVGKNGNEKTARKLWKEFNQFHPSNVSNSERFELWMRKKHKGIK